MRSSARILLVLLSLTALGLGIGNDGVTAADNGATKYQYLAGADRLCGLSPSACPDVAGAANGDKVEITGKGTFVTGSDEVTGGGTFVHKNAAGKVLASGTWTAEELVGFTSFGTAAGVPKSSDGGIAVLGVKLVPAGSTETFEAVLEIDCAINSPPPHAEGVMLGIEDGLKFTNEVSGFTFFVNQGPAEEN